MKIYRTPRTSSSNQSRKKIYDKKLSARTNRGESPWIDDIEMGGDKRKSVLCIEFETKDVFALHERVMRALLGHSKQLGKVIKEREILAEALRNILENAASAKSRGKTISFETIQKAVTTALRKAHQHQSLFVR